MTSESSDPQATTDNQRNSDQKILKFRERLDEARFRSVVDYIVKAIMQRSVKFDAAGKTLQKSPYGGRFMGSYIFGWDFVSQEKTADREGRKFFKGQHTNSNAKLAVILDKIKRNIASGYRVRTKKGYRDLKGVPKPTSAQILEAFQILNRLSTEELNLLELPIYCQHPLLQQAYINLATLPVETGQTVPEIYRKIYQLSLTRRKKPEITPPLEETLNQIGSYLQQPQGDTADTGAQSKSLEEKIRNSLENLLLEAKDEQTRFESLEDISVYVRKYLKDESEEIHQKVMRALKRLLLQAGTGQARFLNLDDEKRYIQNYLSASFIEHLSDTVCENKKLLDRFPIYLKRTTHEIVGVFPLPRPDDDPQKGYLSKSLLTLKSSGPSAAPVDDLFLELPARTVMRVTGHFYIRLNKKDITHGKRNYQGFDLAVHKRMRNIIDEEVRIPFTVETTGIGGTYNMIVQVLNRALLADVEGLSDDYFPVASGLLVDQNNVQQRILSPVSSHSFVQLCHVKAIAKAMKASIYSDDIPDYGEFCDYDPRGSGSHSHFDILNAAANAPSVARLQAIANTGIDPKGYIFAVLARVEQQHILDEGKSLLHGYPFSSFAVTSWLQTKLIAPYEEKNKDETYTRSDIVQKARLTIVETFLTEGAYLKAFKHLKKLHEELNSAQGIRWIERYRQQRDLSHSSAQPSTEDQTLEDEQFNVISGQILVRYEICLARYFSLLDVENESENRECLLGFFGDELPTREMLVRKSWKHLTRAQQHLTVRLMKYHIVDEISQATLHPHYQLLAQIYLYRAKLAIWYPTLLPPENDWYQPPIQDASSDRESLDRANRIRLFLFERARVYAACDGDEALYVISTAHQCRVWLMAAFTMEGRALAFENEGRFSKKQCLDWAMRLRNQAILQYAPIGERCYHAIKEKSGLVGSRASQPYGPCSVDSICAIRETIKAKSPHYDAEADVLYLDMQYLAVRRRHVDADDPTNSQGIYLFGPQSSHLFLIRGLYHLCSHDSSEFSNDSGRNTNTADLNISQWDGKLARCYSLFNYAWAIAGDGCTFSSSGDPNTERRIMRDVGKAQSEGIEDGIKDTHATTVWNLYPHRITEITTLGKIFAAACAAMQCHSAKEQGKRVEWRSETEKLLRSLPCGTVARRNSPDNLTEETYGQERLNGHLIEYMRQSSKIIRDVANNPENKRADVLEIAEKRENLLRAIFSLQAM